eukprot:6210891-Pleurochrysis_carterae.AAC.2
MRLDGNDSEGDIDASPPRRRAGDEQENFHFLRLARLCVSLQSCCKPTVTREGPAWESVIVAPGQELSCGPKVTCKFCGKVLCSHAQPDPSARAGPWQHQFMYGQRR